VTEVLLNPGQNGLMRVLLTGGAGFIGRPVWAELVNRGHQVRVLDSLRQDVHADRPDLAGSQPAGELLVGDVRDPDMVDRALAGVQAVCHLAAKVGLGVDVQDLPDFTSSNDYGTAVLLAGMARAGVRRLTLASSMVVYGEGLGRCAEHGDVSPAPRREADLRVGRFEPSCPACGRPLEPAVVTESAPLDPRSGYAVSKLGQERLAAVWARAVDGSVAVMRYHNVYGPGLPRDTPYAGVAAIFLSALRRGEPPRVFEDGGQRRDFVHVRDVAAATVRAMEQHADGVRAFNVGSGTPRTVGEVAGALAATVGGPAPRVTGEYRLGDVRHITADSTRCRDELGWTPQVGFEQGLAELAGDGPH
jgi:dTDP-L-rhamnose 4-epimerase